MIDRIRAKKQKLDTLRPFSPEALAQLERWYDVELTYTSNAIEGNTLTRQETAIVLEKGLTVRGKPLKDHQEAVDHLEALHFVRELVQQKRPLAEEDIRRSTVWWWAAPSKAKPGVTASIPAGLLVPG